MTIHSSIIRIIIRVIGYFRLLASTRTYVLRYVVRDDSRNFVPSTRQRSTSIFQDSISSLPSFKIFSNRTSRIPFEQLDGKRDSIESFCFDTSSRLPSSPSRAPMPRNGTKLTLTIVVSSWLPFLRVDRLR